MWRLPRGFLSSCRSSYSRTHTNMPGTGMIVITNSMGTNATMFYRFISTEVP